MWHFYQKPFENPDTQHPQGYLHPPNQIQGQGTPADSWNHHEKVMQLNWVFISVTKCQMTPLKAESATINRLHAPVTALMFGCSGTIIHNPAEVRDDGSGQPWDNDPWASWSSVPPRTRTCASRAKGISLAASRGVISTFSWEGKFFLYFSMPPDYWKIGKKQHFICSSLLSFFSFFSFLSLFSFFLSFFLFPWGRPPQMTPLAARPPLSLLTSKEKLFEHYWV